MATLIPSLGSARFDSRGELRLAERLKDFLEDNAFIWHNLPMGPRGRHPDFVIVHPARGLLVLGAGQNAIRLSPSLVLTREQADTAVGILDQALAAV